MGMKENLDKARYWTDGPDCRRQALANWATTKTPSIMTTSHSWVSRLHLLALILPITTKNNFNHGRKSSRHPPIRLLQPQHLPRPKPKPNLKRELVLLPSPQPQKQQPKHAPDAHLPPHQPTATVEHSKLLKQLRHNHPSNKFINHDCPQPGMRLISILQKQRGSWPHNELYSESAAYHMHGTTRHDLLAQQPYPKQHTDGCTTFHP